MFMASQRSRADQGDDEVYYSVEEVRGTGARKTFSTRGCSLIVEISVYAFTLPLGITDN
jgi:hypothetical protein